MGRWTRWESEATQVFNEDIQEKKRTANSASCRVTHGGKMKTPVDMLKGWDKRKYIGNGVVKKMYQMPDTYQEFKNFDLEKQRDYLRYILDQGKAYKSELCAKWSVRPGLFTILAQGVGILDKPEPKPKKPKELAIVSEQPQQKQEVSEEIYTNNEIVIASNAMAARLERIEVQQQQILSMLQVMVTTETSVEKLSVDSMVKIIAELNRTR